MRVFKERTIDLYRKQVEFPTLTESFSIRWDGSIYIPRSGEYEFWIDADDYAEIRIATLDLTLPASSDSSPTQYTKVLLRKGFWPISIRYMQRQGASHFLLHWRMPGRQRETLPFSCLFLSPPKPHQLWAGRFWEFVRISSKFLAALCLLLGMRLVLQYRRMLWNRCGEHGIVVLLLFLTVFLLHFGGRARTSSDSMWSIPTALSLIREKNTDLNEYISLIEDQQYYAVSRIGESLYPVYPLGTPLVAVPFVYVLDRALDRGLAIDLGRILHENFGIRGGIESGIASFLMAMSAVGIYAIGWRLLQSVPYSLLLSVIFAFCTSAWSTGSRALWQHPTTVLLLVIVLYCLIRAKRDSESEAMLVRIVSVLLAFSYVVRPTNCISILLITLYIAVEHRRHLLAYCLWSCYIAVPFVLYNFSIYGRLLPTYYLPQHQFHEESHLFEGLFGTLFSPSRGLFIFSPVLLFALYGILLKVKKRQMASLDYILVLIMVSHWLIHSNFPNWWGGHSYGPRYFADILPYFIYFLAPFISQLSQMRGRAKITLLCLLSVTILFSAFVHFRGAMYWDTHAWNSEPIDVADDHSRLWDWGDLQFLRGL